MLEKVVKAKAAQAEKDKRIREVEVGRRSKALHEAQIIGDFQTIENIKRIEEEENALFLAKEKLETQAELELKRIKGPGFEGKPPSNSGEAKESLGEGTRVKEGETEFIPDFVKSLALEVQLLMRLEHPNVIRVFQVLETEDECYIIM